MDFKYDGIILSKKDVGEADRIYTIFTLEAGKIRVLGKGVRRPNAKLAGHLEPLTRAEIFVAKGKGMGKITGSIVTDNFAGSKADLDSLGNIFYSFGILEKVISEQEEDQAVFYLLQKYLQVVEKISGRKSDKDKKDILALGFLFKLLAEAGYRFEVEKCVICGEKLKPEKNYFSASLGGVLCGNCQRTENKKVKIEIGAIKCLRIFLKNNIDNFVKLNLPEREIQNLKVVLKEATDWILNEKFSA
jgi:DNA repair protein RecO (recombination protein O)